MTWEDILKKDKRRFDVPKPKKDKGKVIQPKNPWPKYTKPQIQIDREKAREEREKKEKEAKERAEKYRRERERYEKTPEYKNNLKIKEFAKKEREKYGVISCRSCGMDSIPSPFVRKPKECLSCGNKLEVEGKDFAQFIKPNEVKAENTHYGDYGLSSIEINPIDHPDAIDWEEGDPRY